MHRRETLRRDRGMEAARRILAEARDPWRAPSADERPPERDLQGFMEPQAPPDAARWAQVG